jgi:patatin-like phospholipase/acyl hydrolase
MRRILSFGGGGIRDTITANTLVKLEDQMDKPVRECFGFIAGTSAGTFIAAATCALNHSPARLLLMAKGIDTHPWKAIPA